MFSSAYGNGTHVRRPCYLCTFCGLVAFRLKFAMKGCGLRACFGGWVKYGSEILGCELNLDEWVLGYAFTSSWFHSELELK